MHAYMHTYIHTCIHVYIRTCIIYVILHDMTLHCTSLHSLYDIILHYIHTNRAPLSYCWTCNCRSILDKQQLTLFRKILYKRRDILNHKTLGVKHLHQSEASLGRFQAHLNLNENITALFP